ncbi:glycosyltransferase family 2 protein [Rhodopseudomonas palustris]|uniref:glycosyltransferase family 2 protein n=1 Tax=Rhodopseudomonas palustris TaxID=1076 RepID=UPI0021F2CFA7|nr:glycosyltransferase family 2 protein [Rhodopseudomonas palustris]UYO53118.1 glycosyltransferase family 2 protein [Rhodopseudomonas palustris]
MTIEKGKPNWSEGATIIREPTYLATQLPDERSSDEVRSGSDITAEPSLEKALRELNHERREGLHLHSLRGELSGQQPPQREGASLKQLALSERNTMDSRTQIVKEVEDELPQARATIASLRTQLDGILGSTTWRALGPLRRLMGKLPRWLKQPLRQALRLAYRGGRFLMSNGRKAAVAIKVLQPPRDPYDRWVEFDTLTDLDRAQINRHILQLDSKPLISVIMPVYETPEWVLREAIASVCNQLYPNWELCIADDASKAPHVEQVLRESAEADPRIKWIRRETNGHISAASNSALALASGEFIALMDHDDVLAPHALYEIAVALNKDPSYDLIYTDEDKIDADGRRCLPYFKTDWNIDLLLAHNMVSHFGVYRRSLVEQVGGFRLGYEGSQDYDLALRCADATTPNRIYHLPAVLYHWRREYGLASFSEGKLAECTAAALRAITDHLERCNEVGVVRPHPIVPQWSRVIRPIPYPVPLVSIIIPTRDRADLLKMCVDGLLHRTDYPAIEILIIDHESALPETATLLKNLKKDTRVRVLPYAGNFNYSAINNMAAADARGSILALLNNDVDVINPDWLREMVALATLDGVGAVGAKLLYPNNRVQHGGVVLGVGGVANHLNHLMHRGEIGYYGRNVLTSVVSAVTGACLVVRKSVFDEVGGFNSKDLPVTFNDVDFCLRIREAGYRNVWTPHAELYHHASASRGAEDTPEKAARFKSEVNYMLKRWTNDLAHDPFYNDNLSIDINCCFQLAFPSRRHKPWQDYMV